MAATSHVARVGLLHIDPLGNVVDKSDPTTTLIMLAKCSTEHRVIEDAAIPNSTGSPTIETYLQDEAADGFLLKHMDQYIIVTEGP